MNIESLAVEDGATVSTDLQIEDCFNGKRWNLTQKILGEFLEIWHFLSFQFFVTKWLNSFWTRWTPAVLHCLMHSVDQLNWKRLLVQYWSYLLTMSTPQSGRKAKKSLSVQQPSPAIFRREPSTPDEFGSPPLNMIAKSVFSHTPVEHPIADDISEIEISK